MLTSHDDVYSGMEGYTLDAVAIKGNITGERGWCVTRESCSLSDLCVSKQESMTASTYLLGVVKGYVQSGCE